MKKITTKELSRCWAIGASVSFAIGTMPTTLAAEGGGAPNTATTKTGASFYKTPPLFSTAPQETKSMETVDRFGPVGIGIELHQPAFVMKVKNIEKGSPAEATGKLMPGQIIETINGAKLQDIDPRIQLGQIITAAEEKDGIVRLMVKDTPTATAQEVIVKIPVLGAYSKTWPLNCPKSDKIVRDFADYLAKPGSDKGFSNIGMLFLLGTGEEKDIAPVREWVHGLAGKKSPTYSWHLGYGGIPLCEYYLRTGDNEALPIIQAWADTAVKEEFMGGWSQKGHAAAVTYGGGGGLHNAAGTSAVTFLMLAKECGAKIPDASLLRVLTQYFRFAGRGSNPYGDNLPEFGLVDNGKNGTLSFAMAAAASLTPNGEKSVYAAARDATALTGFQYTTFMLHGHTGGGIGELWRSSAMGLLYEKKPQIYREFMDNRRWHYELSRRFDGSFGIIGGAAYDVPSWGAGYALTYIVPRKTLRITGAPPSKFSKPYPLPERPWGTKADDVFQSIEAAALPDGTRPDFSNGMLTHDSGRPMIGWIMNPDLDDATLVRYAHHPDHFVRVLAARRIMGLDSTYLGAASGAGKIRQKPAMDLYHSPDSRVRRAIIQAIGERLTGEELVTFLGKQDFDGLIVMLGNPEESWWVKQAILMLLSHAPADALVPHLDLITGFLKHQEWWLQNAALSALAPIATDERCYRKAIPAIGEMLTHCQRWNASGPLRYGPLAATLREAGPEVQKLATEQLKNAYTNYAGKQTADGGLDISTVYNSHLEFIAKTLSTVPGGYDVLYGIAKQRFPKDSLPYDEIFLSADSDNFGPDLLKAMQPLIRDRLIYEHMANNRAKLLDAAAAKSQSQYVGGTGPMKDLVRLYQKIGSNDYEWRPYGPDLKEAKWDYFMFDPQEKQTYDSSPWRYRKVTYPAGMESWFMPDFDPAKAGWKQGHAPFGQYNGKLVTDMAEMAKFKCGIDRPMRTFWDKEVLLMRGTFQIPPLKEGHLYRLRIGDKPDVGCGDGYRIYINGKLLIENKSGIGRREGAQPRGAFITREFIEEFKKGPVTLAATSFLRYGEKAVVTMPPLPQGTFQLWLEEMKVPPLDAETFRKAATLMPMLTSEWQEKQDPENGELANEAKPFHYDGKFVANPKLPGAWTTVAMVPTIEEFIPTTKGNMKNAPFPSLTIVDGGQTNSDTFIWSGDLLMDLNRFQALKITPKTIGKDDYLFIEVGGFSTKNPVGWKSPWVVMKRSVKPENRY